jgi:hypothetical protein
MALKPGESLTASFSGDGSQSVPSDLTRKDEKPGEFSAFSSSLTVPGSLRLSAHTNLKTSVG